MDFCFECWLARPKSTPLREQLRALTSCRDAVRLLSQLSPQSADEAFFLLSRAYMREPATEPELRVLSRVQQDAQGLADANEYATLTIWLAACDSLQQVHYGSVPYALNELSSTTGATATGDLWLQKQKAWAKTWHTGLANITNEEYRSKITSTAP